MRELPFSQIMLAPNAEHDLKIDALPHLSERSSGQKTKKFVRFVRTCRDPQCLQRQAAVTYPAKAVIPVAVAA